MVILPIVLNGISAEVDLPFEAHSLLTRKRKGRLCEGGSGHCDLLRNNATCLGNCHFSDLEDFISSCDVWILN